MPLNISLSGNGRYAAPGGYPVSLSVAGETTIRAVVPKGTATVIAKVKAALGVTPTGTLGATPTPNTYLGAPNVYAALLAAPTTSGGDDGLEVDDTRVSIAGLGSAEQTLTVTVPASTAAEPVADALYIMRLWVESLTGTNAVQITSLSVT